MNELFKILGNNKCMLEPGNILLILLSFLKIKHITIKVTKGFYLFENA